RPGKVQLPHDIGHQTLDGLCKQRALVGIARVDEALGDARRPRNLLDRDAVPALVQEQPERRRQEETVPALRFLPGRPAAGTALELFGLQRCVGHSWVSLLSFCSLSSCDKSDNATVPFGYKRVKSVNRRMIAVTVIILLAAAAGAGWWWTTRVPPPVEWQGYAEADFVKVGPTQQGLLTSLYVARGSRVAAGAPLFDQDDTNDRAAHARTARRPQQAQGQL